MSGSQNLLIPRPAGAVPVNALMARPAPSGMVPAGMVPAGMVPQGAIPVGRPMPPQGMAPQGVPPGMAPRPMPPQGATASAAQGLPPGPPPGPPPGAVPPGAMQGPPTRQAAFAQRAAGLQLPPEQLAAHLKAGDALVSELAKLVRGNAEPTEKQVAAGIGEVLAAAPGAFPVQAAVRFMNAVPDDPDKIRGFLTDRLQDAIASRVHLAGMAARMAGPPPGAMQGPPPGPPQGPPQALPPGAR